MPSVMNVCTQPLDSNGQAKPCPCKNTKKCPDSTIHCDYGERYCMKCHTDEKGIFHHEFARKKDGTFYPCNTLTLFSRDCNVCAFNYKHTFYSSAIGEYRPFVQSTYADIDGDLDF